MVSRIFQKYICVSGVIALFIIFFYQLYPLCLLSSTENIKTANTQRYTLVEDATKYPRNRSMPLIFVGSMPRSGTTLMRAMLDAHPDIRCGEETRVIPRILGLYREEWQSPFESKRLKEAEIEGDVLDNAIAAFILEVIARHGEPAPWLCNKDPFTLMNSMYLHSLFPKAKFILMLRDGRAVVHSIVTRKISILGFDITDYRKCLIQWNDFMYHMYSQCLNLGPDICMPVHYEQLVLQPKQWMETILNFLDIPWHDSVLHHDKLVGKPGGISLSKLERSSDQVIKPVNIDALSKWVGQIPDDVVRDMAIIAPMLANLGYDPYANPPNYGKPDDFVLKNTYFIKQNQNLWAEKEQELEKEKNLFKESIFQKYGQKIEAI